MRRRSFIKSLGAISGSVLASSSCSPKSMPTPKYKMGYQLFSIRDEMEKDPIATLKGLKEIGYEDFELYGFDEVNEKFYGFGAVELKSILNDMGLTITSGHYGLSTYLERSDAELLDYVKRCVVAAKKLDSKYIVWPWIDPEQRTIENFKLMSNKLNLIGEEVVKSGLGFAYHNHGFEFEDHNGENGFDIIINRTDPDLVKMEMDMYWVMHSSDYTPKQLVDTHPGRYKLWHIKDMDKVTRDYTELGNGSIDYITHLPDPKLSGLDYYYIEQGGNFTVNSRESARASAEYCTKHLRKYL